MFGCAHRMALGGLKIAFLLTKSISCKSVLFNIKCCSLSSSRSLAMRNNTQNVLHN